MIIRSHPPPSSLLLSHPYCFFFPKTRHTCASALCKVALRLPDPVRFDAYCFLKGLADAADVFPLIKSHGRTAMGSAACVDETRASSLDDYWREQEDLTERIERGKQEYLFVFTLKATRKRRLPAICLLLWLLLLLCAGI